MIGDMHGENLALHRECVPESGIKLKRGTAHGARDSIVSITDYSGTHLFQDKSDCNISICPRWLEAFH
jgi:hypothetical protein